MGNENKFHILKRKEATSSLFQRLIELYSKQFKKTEKDTKSEVEFK